MLRAILIYLSKADWARRLITNWRFAQKTAYRFVAGDNIPRDGTNRSIRSLVYDDPVIVVTEWCIARGRETDDIAVN